MWKNLLLDQDLLPLLGDSSIFRQEVEALPPNSWVVVDEIQRLPSLLNEIHDIIARNGDRYLFALSGSSARRLKKAGVNLLAGRAIQKRMFPFTAQELGSDFNLELALQRGTIPPVVTHPEQYREILTTYVGTYLRHEIQEEAFVENVASFNRFLKVAAIMNGEQINVSGIARDAGVARTTVERYFSILEDTLITFALDGWQPRLKVRESAARKLYFFDTGVVRSLTGTIYQPPSEQELGKLFETYMLHEIRAYLSYSSTGGEIFYWRTGAGVEIDLIWQRGDEVVAIEFKSAARWRTEYSMGLLNLKKVRPSVKTIGVYRGTQALKIGEISVLPVADFLKEMYSGGVFCAHS